MRIRVIFHLIIPMILSALPALAENSVEQILQLHTRDGKVIKFSLSENPVTTFTEGMLNVSAGDFSASYPLANLLKYTFSSEISGLEAVGAESTVKIGWADNRVSVDGLAPGMTVNVYGIDGSCVATATGDRGVTCIDMTSYPTGVYIVRAENARMKILKK